MDSHLAALIAGVPLGLLYANAVEWAVHRFVLHGLGKRRGSMWNFHWGEHHRNSRKFNFHDPSYDRSPFGWHGQGREALGIAILVLVHWPLAFWAPTFVVTVTCSALYYLYVHKRSHQDPAWARRWLRWHYDHHMGADQDANWCVSFPWFDWVMGTRVLFDDHRAA